MKQRQVAAVVVEAIGVFVLVMAVLNVSRYGLPFFTAIAVGVVYAVFYSATSKISGAHLNPALTLGYFSVRKLSFPRTIAYLAAQALGAVGAWQLYNYLTETPLKNTTTAFDWRVFVAEIVGMLVIGMVIAAIVNQKLEGWQTAATIGMIYFAGMMVAGLASNALLNPAIALGVRSFDLNYVLGPIVGGVLGVALFTYGMQPGVLKQVVAKVKPATAVVEKVSTKKTSGKKSAKAKK